MGNYRFKLSDMMPNVWFYKLKDMGRARNCKTRKTKHPQTSSSTATQTSSSTTSSSSQHKPKQSHQQCNPRKSYHFTRELIPTKDRFHNPKVLDSNVSPPDPPRKSSKQRPKKRNFRSSQKLAMSSSSVSAGCSCKATLESVWTKPNSPLGSSSPPLVDTTSPEDPEFRTDSVLPTGSFDEMVSSWSNTCRCRVSPKEEDIVINVDNNSFALKDESFNGYDSFSELELPPIITKPGKLCDFGAEFNKKENHKSLRVKILKQDPPSSASVKEQRNSPVKGVRLRVHSPRLGCRKVQAHRKSNVSVSSSSSRSSNSRRSISDSFAIVKSSFNPQRDFRESMVEMIVENNIRASKDLEDLLACYLSLNSDEYHDLIIKVFKQIWFDLTDTK